MSVWTPEVHWQIISALPLWKLFGMQADIFRIIALLLMVRTLFPNKLIISILAKEIPVLRVHTAVRPYMNLLLVIYGVWLVNRGTYAASM